MGIEEKGTYEPIETDTRRVIERINVHSIRTPDHTSIEGGLF